jgi:DNA-binding CsgD family transcriptional regulator
VILLTEHISVEYCHPPSKHIYYVRELLGAYPGITNHSPEGNCMKQPLTAATTGSVHNDTLTYSQDGQKVIIQVGNASWYAWLETATTFTFSSEEGTFTAHKARASNKRGGWYWRAYRRQHGHLSRFYLGKSTDLNLQRLGEAAQHLAATTPDQPTANNLTSPDQHPLLDPLSNREREVLSPLASGASNQQIAAQLVITLNTTKRHVKHILAKLSVTNRTQAVARARELNLL